MAFYRTILVAYDGTSASGLALRQGADLALACKARLHVLAIVVTAGGMLLDPAVVAASLLLTERKYLLDAMESAVSELGEQSAQVQTCIRDGEAAAEIIAYAHEITADLIVLGHSDKGVVATWFEGATGSHLLAHAPCSVLIAISRDDSAL